MDPRILVWEYEGSKTLRTLMTDPAFPLNLEPYYYNRGQNPEDKSPLPPARGETSEGRREAEMLRKVMTDLLRATKMLHSIGVANVLLMCC